MSSTITPMTAEQKQLRDSNISKAFEGERTNSTSVNGENLSTSKSISDAQNQFFQQDNEAFRNSKGVADAIFR